MTLSPIPYSDRPLPVAVSNAPADEPSLRAMICHIGRLLHQAHYVDGTSGEISARLDGQRILATPAGLAKGFLQPDQILLLDLEGNNIGPTSESSRAFQPTAEVLMHLDCYRQRPDIQGVVHAHPATAIALTIAGVSMRTCVVPEAIIVLGLVPTAAYSAPVSDETRDAIRALISQHDAILLAYHGSLTVGSDVWQAYLKLETLEHTAMILHRAAQLGPIKALAPEQVEQLLDLRRQLGYWRQGDELLFCDVCGVC